MPTGVRPWLVGLARGLAHALALAAVVFAIGVLSGPDLPDGLQVWAPAIILALRSIEGGLDDRRDPSRQAGLIKGGRL